MHELLNVLLHFGDVMVKESITLSELFDGFDQNASGSVTVSEFCSLLRLVGSSAYSKQAVMATIFS